MTFVVNESCIRCKIMDCVEVCPVDCFYEGENMLVIHPDECIDCGVCVPECPVDAIRPDTEPGLEKWLSLNAEYAKIWPNIMVKKAPLGRLRRTAPVPQHSPSQFASLMRAKVDTRGKQHDRSSFQQNLYSLPRGNTPTHARAS